MNNKYYEPQYKSLIKSVINISKAKRDMGFTHTYTDTIENRYELRYVTEGAVQISTNGMVFKLHPNDLFIQKPNDHSHIKVTDSPFVKYILINFQLYEGILDEIAGSVFHINAEQQLMIREIYDIFTSTFANSGWNVEPKASPNAINERIAFLKMELFLLSLLNTKHKNSDEIVVQNTGTHNYKIINAVMQENINKKLTVSEIAELCHLSVATVKKTMTTYVNCGAMKYFTSLKISRAIEYLKSGASIAETCDFLGFSSISYFSQVFKRETGKSPKEYLKN